jgi:hypothetical protein
VLGLGVEDLQKIVCESEDSEVERHPSRNLFQEICAWPAEKKKKTWN